MKPSTTLFKCHRHPVIGTVDEEPHHLGAEQATGARILTRNRHRLVHRLKQMIHQRYANRSSMPGLDPGIHGTRQRACRKRVNGRVKPGQDDRVNLAFESEH